MRSSHHTAGTFARRAIFGVGSVAALASVGNAVANAATSVPPAHNAPAVKHAEGRSAGQVPTQGSPRRRSAFEPVRPKSLTWAQVQLIQSHRADARLSAKSGLPTQS